MLRTEKNLIHKNKEKAIAALKRYESSQREMGYEEDECAVVNGNGEEMK